MRTVYACYLEFPSTSPPETMSATWSQVKDWVEGRYGAESGRSTGIDWASGESKATAIPPWDEVTITARRVDGKSASELRELSWRHTDSTDPSLYWDVNCAVLQLADVVSVDLVLRIASSDFDIAPARFALGTPRLVRTLVGNGGAKTRGGKIPLTDKPLRFGAKDIDPLVKLLQSPDRNIPIAVVAPRQYSPNDPAEITRLADTLAGVGLVAYLEDQWATFALTDAVGKPWSCFNGAVRLYWPRFADSTSPHEHPLYLPGRIEQFKGANGFRNHLLRIVSGASSFRYRESSELLSFRRALSAQRIEELRASSPDSDDLMDLWSEAEEKNALLEARIADLESENHNYRENAKLQYEWHPDEDSQNEPSPPDVDAEDFSDVLEAVQAAEAASSNLLFLESAKSSASDSPYKNPQKVFHALIAIDDVAGRWSKRLEHSQFRGWAIELKERGFDFNRISQTSAGKWGTEYTFVYEGESQMFSEHITLGAGAPQNCLSIHTLRDNDKNLIIIGHVGRHLRNTST